MPAQHSTHCNGIAAWLVEADELDGLCVLCLSVMRNCSELLKCHMRRSDGLPLCLDSFLHSFVFVYTCLLNLLYTSTYSIFWFSDHVHAKMAKSANASISFSLWLSGQTKIAFFLAQKLSFLKSLSRVDKSTFLCGLGKLSFWKKMIYVCLLRLGLRLKDDICIGAQT